MKKNKFKILRGDCIHVLTDIADNSIDSIVTDPPYGMSQHGQGDIVNALTSWLAGKQYIHSKNGFMGNEWDRFVPGPEVWRECLRVLKPGGYILCFASPRTQDLMGVSLRLAGFEIRDTVSWVFGSGFPKNLNISKQIDKCAGVERKVIGFTKGRSESLHGGGQSTGEQDPITESATEAAKQWDGWGTALKPAHEPIIMARKPLLEKTVTANVLKHGAGGINIGACRVEGELPHHNYGRTSSDKAFAGKSDTPFNTPDTGRWPANLIHDGSEEVVELFPTSSITGARSSKSKDSEVVGTNWLTNNHKSTEYTDKGSAARFFYCAKASKKDRNEGLEEFEEKQASGLPMRSKDGVKGGVELDGSSTDRLTVGKNTHPTVKPVDLMKYLCRLVTPPGGVILDPFTGSGSTGKGAILEGFDFIGIEYDEHSCDIAEARVKHAAKG